MSTGRSPITLMIDRACGFDPSNPPKPRILDEKAIGNAMLEVCDAAEAWKRHWNGYGSYILRVSMMKRSAPVSMAYPW